MLSDEDLASLVAGAETEGYPFGEAVKLLILTGQRRSEVAEMRWSESTSSPPFGPFPPLALRMGKSTKCLSRSPLSVS